MRTARSRLLPIILGVSPFLSQPAWADNAGVTVGTSGLGLDLTMPVGEKLQTRLHLSYLKIDRDVDADDVEYTVNFDNVQVGALLDWHPFSGGFRLTGGLLLADFGVDMNASSEDEYEIGGNTYRGPLTLDGELEFNRVAPFLGFGWGASVGETGLSFAADIGVLLIGEPTLSLEASGTATKVDSETGESIDGLSVDVATNADFQQDLEEERISAQSDLEDIGLYPVINLGISYAF